MPSWQILRPSSPPPPPPPLYIKAMLLCTKGGS